MNCIMYNDRQGYLAHLHFVHGLIHLFFKQVCLDRQCLRVCSGDYRLGCLQPSGRRGGGEGGCACTHTGQDESTEQCAHKPKQEGTECGSEGLPLFTACVSCTARLIRGKTCKQYVLHVYASVCALCKCIRACALCIHTIACAACMHTIACAACI